MTVLADASPRERMVLATYRLLSEGGREAVSIRAVTAAAGVQPPTIYRQFGDLGGLLAEVANHGFRSYITSKSAAPASADPVADLSHGWDLHIAFGLAEPAVYALMYGDPRPGPRPAAVRQARAMLRAIVHRIAEAGRLRVSVDHAANMVDAAGVGVVLHLLEYPPGDRQPALSEAVRDAVLTAITIDDGIAGATATGRPAALAARAVGLKAVLGTTDGRLSPGELHLMNEWLDRLSATAPQLPAMEIPAVSESTSG